MGLFSKLKEAFSKKSLESLTEFESEMEKLKNKLGAQIISIIGIGGRLKGLPLIFAASNEDLLKRYSAKLVEVVNAVKNVSADHAFWDIALNYYTELFFFKPITKNIGLFAVLKRFEEVEEVKQWFFKHEEKLKELFHEQE